MDDKLINFFNFLEKTKGTQTPIKVKIANSDKFSFTKEDLNYPQTLTLNGDTIKSLPDGLSVNGALILYRLKGLEKLPKKLKVKGYLDLRLSTIKSIPEDILVGDGIDMRSTDITELPINLKKDTKFIVDDSKYTYFKKNIRNIK